MNTKMISAYEQIVRDISALVKQKNAIILSHIYQPVDIQYITEATGGYVGDSLGLSQIAARTDADIIVFCGVKFMAETAAILNPRKKVLLPNMNAGCPMADMADELGLKVAKSDHPNATVVTYVNSTAQVKAMSDICCTSSNALKVVRSLDAEEILFVPDANLGRYIASQIPEKKFHFWQGHCPIHNEIKAKDILVQLRRFPDAKILAHPECQSSVLEIADVIGSTKEIVEAATQGFLQHYIIVTEEGVLYQLNKKNPDNRYHLLTPRVHCPDMKKITLDLLLETIEQERNQVTVPHAIAVKARMAIERMLEIK